MKAKVLVLAIVLVLLGSAQVAHGSGESQVIAVGKINWTRNSVCEHPLHPGMYLQYYLTDGCGRNLFLYGNLNRGLVGGTIWAEGVLLDGGWCKVVDMTSFSVCQPPSPGS